MPGQNNPPNNPYAGLADEFRRAQEDLRRAQEVFGRQAGWHPPGAGPGATPPAGTSTPHPPAAAEVKLSVQGMCVVCKKPFQPNEPILVLPCGDGDETTKVSYQEWQHMNRNVLPSGKVHAVHLHCCPAGSSAEAPPWWESDQYQTPDDESIKVFCPCCANGAHKLRLDVLENIAKDQKENAARRGDNLFFYEDFVPRNLWQRLRGKGRVDFKSTPATAAAAVSLSVTGFCRDCDKDITRSDHVAIMSCLDQEAADDWRKTGTHYLPAKGVAALHLECAKKLVEDPEAKCPICGHSVLFRHKDAETLRNKKPQAHQLTYVVHQTPGCCCCF